ncbi:orotate phosphoribosyltransferase [Capnocytophaga catalasegens]|uniref:Orotate phosphoribosyltransferase n=1 Tax=Capnocytophaga catalasegens TaxID=1004260 RepID=A0AAV5AZS5_9FLAO|nr:orotate phosphoribosyltransferase [Capnocytophaga catalasegens]GIZ15482.1 orotate phosphoribosyltransferase [Capnocytophaga catalasegens]GJM51070.1 orotate phosphoribosyltransferase [Capnocytophaga catalasegens]GJM52255.1 orotate phosphoribosyltransferase [Capnocytophaga catalasegens]
MILENNTAKKVAELLLQINAIKLNSENPFTWASGWRSPIYCDNRIILSYPTVREQIAENMAQQIKRLYGIPDLIAGVATGAIGIGLLVAEKLKLPFIYVRPEPKKHGRQNQIEGKAEKGQKVVVIEDLISTGMSSLNAISALKNNNLHVLGMLAIFSYGFDTAIQNFAKENVTIHSLSDYEHLLEKAIEIKYISENELETLKKWRTQPEKWNQL